MTTIAPTTLATMAATPKISSATAPNWLAEAYTAIVSSENQSGLLGALQNSRNPGSISSFLNNTVSSSSAFALIAQNGVSASGKFSSEIAAATYEKAVAEKLQKAFHQPDQTNYTPPKGLDAIIYFEDGSTLDTVNSIMTFADGKQIDTTTGLPFIDPGSIINMPDGSYLDTKNNVLTLPDGTKIDIITGLDITV